MSSFTYLALFFILFAVSRTFLRYRDGTITLKEMFFWLVFWLGTTIVVTWPGQTERVAKYLGIQRGSDAMVYMALILIYYLVFRIYIKINIISHDITRLIRQIAVLQPYSKSNGKDK